MDWINIHSVLVVLQHSIAFCGIFIILTGILLAMVQYLYYVFTAQLIEEGSSINVIRINLGRILILGLEFIVAADLIGTISAPDYYTVGLLAIIVAIRTLLSYSISHELMTLSKET